MPAELPRPDAHPHPPMPALALPALVILIMISAVPGPGLQGDEPIQPDPQAAATSIAETGEKVPGSGARTAAIPDKLVVLTFDDSSRSHFTIARPILKKHGFGATFFITEGWDFATNKNDYMTWEEIAQLHRDGFEIGNHTRDHMGVDPGNIDRLAEQLQAITDRCAAHAIPAPVTFAWPGNMITEKAFPILRAHGIRFARRGGVPEYPYEHGEGFAVESGEDHPLLLPSAGDARPDWNLDNFIKAATKARDGRVAILQFHGVPDTAHLWVSTEQRKFARYMQWLATNGYKAIALRDLQPYLDPTIEPGNPMAVIEARKARQQQ